MIVPRPNQDNPARRRRVGGNVLDLRPKTVTESPLPTPASIRKETIRPRRKRSFRIRPKKAALIVIKLIVIASTGVVLSNLGASLPEALIGLYAAAAIVFAIDSQRAFMVALIFLVLVAIFSALSRQNLAENYAVYAFYFLVIGLFSAIRELLMERKNQP